MEQLQVHLVEACTIVAPTVSRQALRTAPHLKRACTKLDALHQRMRRMMAVQGFGVDKLLRKYQDWNHRAQRGVELETLLRTGMYPDGGDLTDAHRASAGLELQALVPSVERAVKSMEMEMSDVLQSMSSAAADRVRVAGGVGELSSVLVQVPPTHTQPPALVLLLLTSWVCTRTR